MTHIGSGTSTEANSALEVLDTLVNTKLPAVQRFTLLIKVVNMHVYWMHYNRSAVHCIAIVFSKLTSHF